MEPHRSLQIRFLSVGKLDMTKSPSQGLSHLPGNPFKRGQYSESPQIPQKWLMEKDLGYWHPGPLRPRTLPGLARG